MQLLVITDFLKLGINLESKDFCKHSYLKES